MEKKLEEVINRLEALKEEIARLEIVIAELKAADAVSETVPAEEAVDLSEPIDLTLTETDYESVSGVLAAGVAAGTATAVEEVAEQEIQETDIEEVAEQEAPVADVTDMDHPDTPAEENEIRVSEESEEEPVAEDLPSVDEEGTEEDIPVAEEPVAAEPEDNGGFFGLFGEEIAPVQKEQRGRRRRESIAEAAAATRTVADAMEAAAAWRTDIPGPEVKSLRSAIALGDQVLFIARLFRKDSALYQDTVDRLNATATLSDALAYLSETFPEWDLASDDVYKFMMAVRRKIRR